MIRSYHKGVLVFLCILFSMPSWANAQSVSGTSLDNCFRQYPLWAPKTKKLAKSERWKREGRDRIDYEGSQRKALRSSAEKGEKALIAQYSEMLDKLEDNKATAVRMQVDMYIPKDNGFNTGSAKMPFGLYGGDADEIKDGFCGSGGCPPNKQNGFTVRLTRRYMNKKTKVDGIMRNRHQPEIYSYHLNRNKNTKPCSKHGTCMHGAHFTMTRGFPTSQWVTIVLDVVLNDVGRNNGFVHMYMYKKKIGGVLERIGAVKQNGLKFRDSKKWYILGPRLTDMWGSGAQDDIPIADTEVFFKNYKIYLAKNNSPSHCPW